MKLVMNSVRSVCERWREQREEDSMRPIKEALVLVLGANIRFNIHLIFGSSYLPAGQPRCTMNSYL